MVTPQRGGGRVLMYSWICLRNPEFLIVVRRPKVQYKLYLQDRKNAQTELSSDFSCYLYPTKLTL